MASQAALISYNGYERDTAKNYVIGGGLEWLMWDVTKGMTINSALSAHDALGWRLASNIEMAALFNKFKFSSTSFTSAERGSQITRLTWDPTELSPHRAFVTLFGNTYPYDDTCKSLAQQSCFEPTDSYLVSSVIYGSDDNRNNLYKLAQVSDDYTERYLGQKLMNNGEASLYGDWYYGEEAESWRGVALVRATSIPPSVVPTPGSIGLLALGLVALCYRRRQMLGR